MPNHFHFILKQIKEHGVPNFMRKMGTGYTNYFNQRYERSGALFQGRYKAILVNKDNYFNYLQQYIYLNPLELIEPDWKEGKIKNWEKAKVYLDSYKWRYFKNYKQNDQIDKILNKSEIFDQIKNLIIE
jgi:putative transposase